MGETSEAIAHYEAALRLVPTIFQAHHNLGVALATQANSRSGRPVLRSRPSHPSQHKPRRNLAQALTRLGRLDEAKLMPRKPSGWRISNDPPRPENVSSGCNRPGNAPRTIRPAGQGPGPNALIAAANAPGKAPAC